MISRRQLLGALAAALGPAFAGAEPAVMPGESESSGGCFSLGVASGDPGEHELVLWTRLCRGALDPGFDSPIEVAWELALDVNFERIVQEGRETAIGERAHCVHVFANDLSPDTRYFYRFIAKGQCSPVGISRTLPASDSRPEHFRIALTSCQEYSSGYFAAYRDLVDHAPDLVFHTGDYIYETAAGRVRSMPFDWQEATSLEHYRALYALYRQDADLRAAHATAPWVIIWDDHEVVNDWGPEHFLPSPFNSPFPLERHASRVAAARRAFLEHMPLRASSALYKDRVDSPHRDDAPTLYRRFVVGDLFELTLLDQRSYRDTPVCNAQGALSFVPCAAAADKDRSMLGADQEDWLYRHFGSSACRWNLLGQTTMFAAYNRGQAGEPIYETDSWDNYRANRARIMEHIANRGLSNVVSLAGNIHAYYVGTVSTATQAGPVPLMAEIITTSVSAGGGGEARYRQANAAKPINPGMLYFDNRYRGYSLIDIRRERIDVAFRALSDVGSRVPDVDTLASFEILQGTSAPVVTSEGGACGRVPLRRLPGDFRSCR